MPYNIETAFRSTNVNECYVFAKGRYVVVNYAPGGKKNQIISGPTNIVDGFPLFARTPFEYQIDSFLDTGDNVTYFIFSRDLCIKAEYSPQSPAKARLLLGPIPIVFMFPCLKGTVFENGIDATMRFFSDSRVYLFKGDEVCFINYQSNELYYTKKIRNFFRNWVGTVFEGGIDAIFNSHIDGEIYIFKGQYYARYNIGRAEFINGAIKLISDDWLALQSLL